MDEPKFPEYIQQRITMEFLTSFKNELEIVFEDKRPDKPTYWNYYQFLDTTCGFYSALEKACEIHDFMDLYEYLHGLEWYDSDKLDSSLTEMLYKYGIIEEGSIGELYYYHTNLFTRLKYRLILFKYNIKQYYKLKSI